MRKNTKRKLAVIAIALAVAAVMLPALVLVLRTLRAAAWAGWTVVGVLVLYGLTAAAIFVGVLAAMRERLREIDGGEEDEAKKY